jgi:hypothetical protein
VELHLIDEHRCFHNPRMMMTDGLMNPVCR